jgi:hypothetical protein
MPVGNEFIGNEFIGNEFLQYRHQEHIFHGTDTEKTN